MPTHADRILDFVGRFPGRDDDEISASLGIRPRQAVNQACRRLAAAGLLRRVRGSSGKLVNHPTTATAAGTPVAEPDTDVLLPISPSKPALKVKQLERAGFTPTAAWRLTAAGELETHQPLPKPAGVYAFSIDGVVQYVGLATMGLAKRLRFYARPGSTQRTSQRLNAKLKAELASGQRVEIHTATPEDLIWNGLPMSGAAGLEFGLIQTFHLPWNIRGAR